MTREHTPVTPEEIATFWSEWTDDNAPLRLGEYRTAAEGFLAKYVVLPKVEMLKLDPEPYFCSGCGGRYSFPSDDYAGNRHFAKFAPRAADGYSIDPADYGIDPKEHP